MVDPAGLIEAARALVSDGAPSDAALRRSVSTAYYAMFHAITSFAADRFAADRLGDPGRASATYALIYRGFNHRRMKDVCEELAKSTLKASAREALRRPAVCPEMKRFASAFELLQQLRHLADYHPTITLTRPDVLDVIDETEGAVRGLDTIPRDQLMDVVTYMLVGARAT